MVNDPLVRPYFLGGLALGGVPLDSHYKTITFGVFFSSLVAGYLLHKEKNANIWDASLQTKHWQVKLHKDPGIQKNT